MSKRQKYQESPIVRRWSLNFGSGAALDLLAARTAKKWADAPLNPPVGDNTGEIGVRLKMRTR
jgi:hypothetical protein